MDTTRRVIVLLDCHKIVGGLMARPSVHRHKPAQGILLYIVLDTESDIRAVIGGLEFLYDVF